MKTHELFTLLNKNREKSLIFEYTPNEFVGTNYHITEVKHVKIDAIDCGSNSDSWNETIIQLWESPSEIGKPEFMSTTKALSILKKVGTMKAYDMNAEVKFEYGNTNFHTAQLFVNTMEMNEKTLIVKLAVEKADCKAKSECGTNTDTISSLVREEPCCGPDGNCC